MFSVWSSQKDYVEAQEATVAFGAYKKKLLLSGDSKSLAILGYCYIIGEHHLKKKVFTLYVI